MRALRSFPFFAALWVAALSRGAEPAPPPAYAGLLSLVRYDQPIGRSDGYAPTRQLAQRITGQDAVDWPEITLHGTPLFRASAEEQIALNLRSGPAAASPFQLKEDERIEPGNHWFRPMEWRGGRRHIYTADKNARAAASTETMSGRYELWTFPIRLEAEGAPIKIVRLRAGGRTVFSQDGPWRSLTLLLPATAPNQPYELSIDGRPPLKIEAGLMPVKLGSPREKTFALDATLGGDGPKIRVHALSPADSFPHAREWEADRQALKAASAKEPPRLDPPTWRNRLGVEAPRSPLLIYAMQLPHGLSGGFLKQTPGGFEGSPEDYATFLAQQGFDAVFDLANYLPEASAGESFERQATALASRGLKLGLQYDNDGRRPALQHPEVAFFAHTLPEWHAPLYRSLSLAAQRFGRQRNFLGFSIGGTSDGYAGNWFSVPPAPDRPWGEAMIEFAGGQPAVPRAPGAGPPEQSYEYRAKTTAEFLRYVQRYDTSFQQYGYFAEAVRQANPRLIFTTGSFGSSPGPGARGGWPWSSIPGRVMFEGLNVQQAYDWNQSHASKPMHNEALTDRLESYWPRTATWSLLDNYQLLYGREAYQRACALALTRGIQGLGTNFLALPSGPAARPDVVAAEREMHAWIHRFGGVYARTEPLASIGVFFGQHQAVQRGVLAGASPAPAQLIDASHEGKVTEALFFCHAAGWPARVVTYQEINRGPLPPSMSALLLVGLKPEDASWSSNSGLEKALEAFIARGGRIIADADSRWVAPLVSTEMRVAAYQPQSSLDPTPLLLARNAGNIEKLRLAMQGAPLPAATSNDSKLWAIPTRCGDVDYVTAVNQSFADDAEAQEVLRPPDPKATRPEVWKTKANASLYVKPQTGALEWHDERPVYDLRLGRQVTAEEAATVDLTHDAFAFYALPPAEPTAPKVKISKNPKGLYEAAVTTGATPIRGVPVKLVLASGGDSVELYGATGFPVVLPLSDTDQPGAYLLTCTELLSGLASSTRIDEAASKGSPPAAPGPVRLREPAAVAKFAARRAVPLIVALTEEQAKDPAWQDQARVCLAAFKSRGRDGQLGSAAPGGVVESLQPLKSPHRYPQWKTAEADLVLFGTTATNVLILDQRRAEIFPLDFRDPAAGRADVIYARSPFVGECDVLNIVASDPAGAAAALKALPTP